MALSNNLRFALDLTVHGIQESIELRFAQNLEPHYMCMKQ